MAEVTWSFPTIRPSTHQPPIVTSTARREPPVHIESYGYTLRSLRKSDASEELLNLLNSPDLQSGLNIEPLNFSLQDLAKFIARFDDEHNYFIGIFKKNNLKGFYTIDVNKLHRTGLITAGISESASREDRVYWATIESLLEHMFTYRGLEKISARILANNKAMLFNFIDSRFFKHEATLKHECMGINGDRQDLMIFSTLKGEENPDGVHYENLRTRK